MFHRGSKQILRKRRGIQENRKAAGIKEEIGRKMIELKPCDTGSAEKRKLLREE